MNDQNSEKEKLESAILSEKVREIEMQKLAAKNLAQNNTAKILNEKRRLSAPVDEKEAKKQMAQRSRRTFLIGGAAAVAGIFGWRWLSNETLDAIYNQSFRFNERVSQFFYSPKRLAPEFPKERIGNLRVNGGEGMSDDFDPANWTLRVGGLAGRNDDLVLTLDDIKALPRTEMTTELKCVEGWSTIVNWAGVRFSDFIAKHQKQPEDLPKYVSLVTPDEGYYVGWDLPSILHPQTLLAYEMNGAPLTVEHGAPLRLASPTKYGIKQIKRIGRIEFTDERPKDFWNEQGYDWYSGH